MPDMIQPVGAQIQPPDLGKALSPLSSVLGLRQQQQALQTGAYQQQTAQGAAQQSQQSMQERQAFQQAMQNGVDERGDSLYGDDPDSVTGKKEPDPMKVMAFAQRNMPLTGQAVIGSILKNQSDRIGLQSASADLSDKYRDDLSGIVRSGIQSGAKSQDLTGAIGQYVQLNPQAAKAAQYINSQLAHLDNAPNPQARDKMLNALSQQIQPPAATRAQQGSPYGTATTVDTGGEIQPGVQAPAYEGGGFTPSGKAIPKAPQQVMLPTGQIGNRSPGTGAISVAPTAGGGNAPSSSGSPAQPAPNINPTRAQVDTQVGLAKGVTERVSQAQAAANNTSQAQDALTRARAILDNPEGPDTGAGFENKKAIMNFLSGVGIDTKGADDANTLAKNLARYEAARATQAGLGGTDAARELAHNGSPNVSLDNKALKGVVTQSLATEKALASYANIQSKTQDPTALAKNESDFRNIPNLIQGYEYGLARNPKEADEFLTRHGISREEMGKTRQMIKEFEARGQ